MPEAPGPGTRGGSRPVGMLAGKMPVASGRCAIRAFMAFLLATGFANPALSQTPHATLGDPLAVFGEDERNPDELLGAVAAVVHLGSDLWAVGDALSRTIHIVSGTGTLVRTLGGDGDGPGEFRSIPPGGLWRLAGGGLGAWDPRLRRVTHFRGDALDEIETVTIQQDNGIGPPSLFVGAIPDGLLLASIVSGPMSEREPGPVADRHEVGLFGPDGNFIRKVADLSGFVRARSGMTSGPIPFSPHAMFAGGPDRIAFTNGVAPEIRVLTAEGTGGVLRVEAAGAGEAGGAALARAWRELESLARAPGAVSGFWTSVISTLDRSIGSVPAVGAMVGGGPGLWVQPYEVARHAMPFRVQGRGAPGGTWDVYDWAGTRRGTVRVPDDFTPMTLDERWVAGIRISDLGVESFAVYARPF